MSVVIAKWNDVKNSISKKNLGVVKKLDSIPGVDNFNVIVARYKFGQDLIKKGQFYLNINGNNTPYDSEKIDKQTKKLLNYHWRTIPFGMVTHNTTESHINHSTHIVPFMLLPPGKTFGMLSLFDPHQYSNLIPGLYSTTSGCRSLIMLNQITHTKSNNRLAKEFNITKYLSPKNLSEQWFLFKELADSPNFKSNWESEVIFFTSDFVNAIHNTPAIGYDFLYTVWDALSFRRNWVTHEFIWSIFLMDLPLSLKHDPLIVETVKHIVLLAMKEAPGYVPASDNMAAPISDFIEVFLSIYKIRYRMPIFMRLSNYNGTDPIYYSLHKHTFFHELPNRSSSRQTINELINIKRILFSFIDYILNNKFEHSLENTLLYKTLNETEFSFYHPKGNDDINSDIDCMIQEDKRFKQSPYKGQIRDDFTFPERSVFFNGCIRIRPKRVIKKDDK